MLKTFIREIGSLSNFSLFTCSSSVARESLASELRFAAQQKSAEYHSGHNVGLKNDDTHAGNPIGVNLSDNVVWQTDGIPKVDGVGQKNIGVGDCIDMGTGNKTEC
ncbi:uncharacterized protein LOC107858531 isoform X3 [Capsicum annuum]|uniref:uncharacterized protein LOC107858531 isoform X3 n=1 Tax=Capsicum annuum TaxID=4072 RepID=UPI001FB15495|nr:uncharacterized protein LOC107858531 isoform X3 [Capsicum annuum]